MPISPAYSWTETATTVTVTAECRGASTAKTDTYSSPYYVSVNTPPYFLELDLKGAIDGTRSVATVRQGVVTLKLFKAVEGQWDRLITDLAREERLKRRQQSRDMAAEEAQAALERKKRAVWDDSRFSLGKQMDKDRDARVKIEAYKEAEKEAGAAALAAFAEEAEATAAVKLKYNVPVESAASRFDPSKIKKPSLKSEEARQEKTWQDRHAEDKARQRAAGKRSVQKSGFTYTSPKTGEVTSLDAAADDDDEDRIVEITGDEEGAPPLIDGSSPTHVERSKIFEEDEEDEGVAPAAVTDPLALKAAKKASAANAAAAEEEAKKAAAEAYAAKAKAQAKAAAEAKARTAAAALGEKGEDRVHPQMLTAPARTKTDNAAYDLPLDPLTAPEIFKGKVEGDISQRDPAWLKDRGDRYFRMGDWRSAEEAYTMVLNQFAKSIMGQAIDVVTACYSNRAACRIHTSNSSPPPTTAPRPSPLCPRHAASPSTQSRKRPTYAAACGCSRGAARRTDAQAFCTAR